MPASDNIHYTQSYRMCPVKSGDLMAISCGFGIDFTDCSLSGSHFPRQRPFFRSGASRTFRILPRARSISYLEMQKLSLMKL